MTVLIGRDTELAVADSFLADESGQRLLLIDGVPGIGKTAFLTAIVDGSRKRGHFVLGTHPAEVERELSFTGLGDMLADADPGDLRLLPEPQRAALEIALLLRSPGPSAPAPRAVATAVLNLLRFLSRRNPVVLTVDDAQWLDQATAQALRFSIRRITTEDVRLILVRRSGTAPELGGWVDSSSFSVLELGPLTLGATHAVLMSQLDVPVKRPVLRQIHQWSRGNPLHALELGRAFDQGTIRFEASASVPIGLEHLVASRVRRLPEETKRALAAIASASALTRAQLAAITPGDVDQALAPAEADNVVEIADGVVRFTHPLLASAAYASIDPGRLRTIHAALADIIDDPDESARHLAHSIVGTDEGVAGKLEQAAESVFHRGSPFLAAGLAQLSRETTPPESAPDLERRALAEAEYRFEAGDTTTASNLVSVLVGSKEPGPERARLLALLARYHHFESGLAESARHLEEARRESGDDPALRFTIEEGLAWNRLLMRADLVGADGAAHEAIEFAEATGDQASVAEALAVAALTTTARGGDGIPMMRRALELEGATLHLRVLRHPGFSYASLLTALDRFEEARRVFDELVSRAEAAGDESALPTLLHHIALVECLRGRYETAMQFAREAVAVAAQDDQIPACTSALGRVALIEARVGNAPAAKAAATEALTLASPDGFEVSRPVTAMTRGGETAIWALGTAAILEGDLGAAAETLTPMAEVFRRAGYLSRGDTRFVVDTIEALALSGEANRARELVAWIDEMPRDNPGGEGTKAQARALLAIADGDFSLADDLLVNAVERFQSVGLVFEQGRALLLSGKVRRRSRSKGPARQTLDEAGAVFSAQGSRGWSELAESEAERVGAGTRPASGLTDTEEKVALLVAEGLTNKEVAQRMFISTKAVEATLTRLYSKVGIKSRTELVRWALERPEI